ncbi:MAG: trehalose-phosphatase [Pseudomonadota bacterium]
MTTRPPRPDPVVSALFLDVDGTLLPIQDDPAAVVSDDPLRQLLAALGQHAGGALAVVSGRTLAEIDRIFAPLTLSAAGTHGGQIRHAGRDLSPPGLATLEGDALIPLEQFVAEHPGTRLEHKGVSITLHYRQRPELDAECRALMEALHARDPAGTTLIAGKMVYEVTPRDANKGDAIRRLLDEPPFAARQPVFIGDDTTDEAGFAVVNERGGISIRVGGIAASQAQFALADVTAVHRWLRDLTAPAD